MSWCQIENQSVLAHYTSFCTVSSLFFILNKSGYKTVTDLSFRESIPAIPNSNSSQVCKSNRCY